MGKDNFNLDNVDDGIREVVLFLRNNDFNTIESCQGCGYDNNLHPHPAWVAIEKDDGKTEEETRCRLEKILISAGYKNFSTYIRHLICDGLFSDRKIINVDFGGAINANIDKNNTRWNQLPWEHLGLAEGFKLLKIVPIEKAEEIYKDQVKQGYFDYILNFKEKKLKIKK